MASAASSKPCRPPGGVAASGNAIEPPTTFPAAPNTTAVIAAVSASGFVYGFEKQLAELRVGEGPEVRDRRQREIR